MQLLDTPDEMSESELVLGSMWNYSQETGDLSLDNNHIATGYSGHGEGLNSHDHECVKNVGPIPVGDYTIGSVLNHPTKGPVCMRLFPVDHDAHGRDGFMNHGDNSHCNKSASDGCVILSRKITNGQVGGAQ